MVKVEPSVEPSLLHKPLRPGQTVAVLDLGSNTFLLLLARYQPGNQWPWEELGRQSRAVKLSRGLSQTGRISEDSFRTGLETLKEYTNLAREQEALCVALGTAALRRASNGQEFIQAVLASTGIPVHLIRGETEARLINRGIRAALALEASKPISGSVLQAPMLCMDMGGGSTEFIWTHNGRDFGAQSLPLGSTVLQEQLGLPDPAPLNLPAFDRGVAPLLNPLFKIWDQEHLNGSPAQPYTPEYFLGTAGSFNTFRAMLAARANETAHIPMQGTQADPASYSAAAPGLVVNHLPREALIKLMEEICTTPLHERLKMPGMVAHRAQAMPLACRLTHLFLKKFPETKVLQCTWSLREGVLDLLQHQSQLLEDL